MCADIAPGFLYNTSALPRDGISPKSKGTGTAGSAVLPEVNLEGEATNTDVLSDAVEGLLPWAGTLLYLEVKGHMTIPRLTHDPDRARAYFRRLRVLVLSLSHQLMSSISLRNAR